MRKKILLQMMASGAMALSPLAVVVSCRSSSSADLKIGIRPEDAKMWKSVVEQFEKATDKKVKLVFVNDQQQNYKLWKSSKTIPNITIADSGTAQAGMENGWFQSLNLKNIIQNKDFKVSSTGEWAEKDRKFDADEFEMAMMNVNVNKDDSDYSAAAIIYGPKITYSWKKLPLANGAMLNLFDGSEELKWFVPNKLGTGLEEVTFSGSSGTSSPLYSLKDDQRLMNTEEDIQEFISRAISQADLQYNQTSYNRSSLNSNDPMKRVIATGMPGYKQRMASIGKLLYDIVQRSALSWKKDVKIGSFSDNSIPYSNLALGKAQYAKTRELLALARTNLDAKSKLDEKIVFQGDAMKNSDSSNSYKIRITRANASHANATELEIINYLSVFGYARAGAVGSSGIFPQREDSQVGFGKGYTLMLPNGALWQKNSIFSKIKNKLNIEEEDVKKYITVFAQPIQETNVDGYAISKETTGEKLILAKKFLRFLFQQKVAATITGTKAISTLKDAQSIQPKGEPFINAGLEGAGTKWFSKNSKDAIEGIPWILAKSTYNSDSKTVNVKSIYDTYNNYFMNGSGFDGGAGFTFAQTMTKITKYNKQYLTAAEI